MIKHIGKHNNKKIVLLFREVPGEDHMCLVSYSDTLPTMVHDSVMKTLESSTGQQAENFADALFRTVLPNGSNTLTTLHTSGLIKKVPTNQVTVTPNAKSFVKLDELNRLLNEMSKGQAASKRLEELDRVTTKNTPRTKSKDVGDPVVPNITDFLDNSDLAKQRIDQANRMKADAERLLKEAEVLMAEAAQLNSTVVDEPKTKKKPATKAKKS